MARHAEHFDFVLDTIPVGHDVDPDMRLVERDGTMVIVGAVEPLKAVNAGPMVFRRKTLAGSLVGGIAEMQEMLDFCAEHGGMPDCETTAIQDIDGAFERLLEGDVKYRFAIDMASIQADRRAA